MFRKLALPVVVACACAAAACGSIDGQRAIDGIHLYQRWIAPVAARIGVTCRFTPSCSHYAERAIAQDGLLVGGWRSLRRIARCGPWTVPGTYDPP